MPNKKENPKSNVISFRVHDAEKSILIQIASQKGEKISDVCHQAIQQYLADKAVQTAKTIRARKAA